MSDKREYEMRAISLPDTLVNDAIMDLVLPPRNSFEAERALARQNSIPAQITDFTAKAVDLCKGGQRVVLLRDILSPYMTDCLKYPNYFDDLDKIEDVLMELRLRIGDNLMTSGAEVIVEGGVLTQDDFTKDTPRRLKYGSTWTNIRASDQGTKVSCIAAQVEGGPRPNHRLLHPETVYRLHGEEGKLAQRFGFANWDPQLTSKFYLSVSPYVDGKKTLIDALIEKLGLDNFEKLMLDVITSMEVMSALHDQGIVHRDLKADNIFEGGVVTDNVTMIKTKVVTDDRLYGTPPFMMDAYPVIWDSPKNSLYFRDIFSLAMSIAEAIALAGRKRDTAITFFEKHKVPKGTAMKPEVFMKFVREHFSTSIQNEKVVRATDIIEKMILGQGKYTLADALRDLSAIFGSKQ